MKAGINIWRALRDVTDVHPAWAHVADKPYTEADLPRPITTDRDVGTLTGMRAVDDAQGTIKYTNLGRHKDTIEATAADQDNATVKDQDQQVPADKPSKAQAALGVDLPDRRDHLSVERVARYVRFVPYDFPVDAVTVNGKTEEFAFTNTNGSAADCSINVGTSSDDDAPVSKGRDQQQSADGDLDHSKLHVKAGGDLLYSVLESTVGPKDGQLESGLTDQADRRGSQAEFVTV